MVYLRGCLLGYQGWVKHHFLAGRWTDINRYSKAPNLDICTVCISSLPCVLLRIYALFFGLRKKMKDNTLRALPTSIVDTLQKCVNVYKMRKNANYVFAKMCNGQNP